MSIIRTKTRATGGITADEKKRLDAVVQEWIGIAMRTDPIEPDKIVPAIKGLYKVAELKEPRVVIVPSPLAMAFAYGASAWIWHCRKNNVKASDATRAATVDATSTATYVATDAAASTAARVATRVATDVATYVATDAATHTATDAATRAATHTATHAATVDATYVATDAATYVATDAATRAATDAATHAANVDATYAVTVDATYAATDAATRAATRVATDAATHTATHAATVDATGDATDAATDAATRVATRVATHAATNVATVDATYAATVDATYIATDAAIYDATGAATYAATDAATRAATDAATGDATDAAIYDATGAAAACHLSAGAGGIECAKRWNDVYQGGNMWAGWCSYLAGFRDAIGLDLPEYAAYQFYEDAARHGGFRVMHEEFCIVSDFPEIIKKDEQNRPHCEDGPSHRWRDGWSLYHWHGVRVPDEWIKNKSSLTAQTALSQENVELRRAACEILGWAKVLKELNAKLIDADGDPEIGELLEVDLPESEKERFLKVQCGTGREFAIPVPPEMQTAIQASAWTYGIDELDTYKPEVRT